jgi:hypothetical protein
MRLSLLTTLRLVSTFPNLLLLNLIGGVGCDNMTCILILFKQSEYAK